MSQSNNKTVANSVKVETNKEGGETMTNVETTIVPTTHHTKTVYEAIGVARKQDGRLFVYLTDGTKLVVSRPLSSKQNAYYQDLASKKFENKRDLGCIYSNDYRVDMITDTIVDEDLQDDKEAPSERKEPTAREKLYNQEDTQKKADAKTNSLINKELQDEYKDEEEESE